jgi:hypothetical protein
MSSITRRVVDRATYEGMTIVARYPGLALPVARLRGHGAIVDVDTDVLIEGYPRSANSFAVAAFGLAQPGPVRIAHHTHAPAHVIAAVRRGIPALVLIREPEDAVLEFVIVKPHLNIGQALRGYLRFYEPLLAHRRGFVIGAFPEVTADFGAVIRRLNQRFGTRFAEFRHTRENVQACFDAMDGYWEGRVGKGLDLERLVGRPSAVREKMKDRLREGYRAERLAGTRKQAQRVYGAWRAPQ